MSNPSNTPSPAPTFAPIPTPSPLFWVTKREWQADGRITPSPVGVLSSSNTADNVAVARGVLVTTVILGVLGVALVIFAACAAVNLKKRALVTARAATEDFSYRTVIFASRFDRKAQRALHVQDATRRTCTGDIAVDVANSDDMAKTTEAQPPCTHDDTFKRPTSHQQAGGARDDADHERPREPIRWSDRPLLHTSTM